MFWFIYTVFSAKWHINLLLFSIIPFLSKRKRSLNLAYADFLIVKISYVLYLNGLETLQRYSKDKHVRYKWSVQRGIGVNDTHSNLKMGFKCFSLQ